MVRSKFNYDLLKMSSLGLEMGAAVVIGLLVGMYLDRRFGSEPWLTLIFLGFGMVAAGKAVHRAVKGSLREEEMDEGES